MSDIAFKIKGSAEEPYDCAVTLSPLTVICSCPAGAYMPVCKHRLQIIQGKASGIVEGDMADLVKIVETGKAIGAPAMAAQYEKAKAEKARLDKKMENLLKGYIDARVRRLTGELKTDRNIDAARTDLERTIEEAVIAGAELSKALLALSKIFV